MTSDIPQDIINCIVPFTDIRSLFLMTVLSKKFYRRKVEMLNIYDKTFYHVFDVDFTDIESRLKYMYLTLKNIDIMLKESIEIAKISNTEKLEQNEVHELHEEQIDRMHAISKTAGKNMYFTVNFKSYSLFEEFLTEVCGYYFLIMKQKKIVWFSPVCKLARAINDVLNLFMENGTINDMIVHFVSTKKNFL